MCDRKTFYGQLFSLPCYNLGRNTYAKNFFTHGTPDYEASNAVGGEIHHIWLPLFLHIPMPLSSVA